MKIDLLDFVDSNKRIENLEKEAEFRKELNELISCVIVGKDHHSTKNYDLIKKLDLKAEKFLDVFSDNRYMIKINRSNIKKIQKFIDNERYEDEEEY